MSKVIERKADNKFWFTPDQRDNLKKMYKLVDDALEHMEMNLKADGSHLGLVKAKELENAINKYRDALRKEYLKNVSNGSYNIHSGMIYNDLFSSMEKIGDHVINVSEALVNEYTVKA
jgi:phosphate:Na+ symporter